MLNVENVTSATTNNHWRRGREGVAELHSLTGIRAIAAALVLFLHLAQAIPNARIGDALPFVHFGYLGVDLFFILSGFIISHVYSKELARFDVRRYATFLWYRFARIYPIHFVVLALLVLMVAAASVAGIAFNSPENWQFSAIVWHLILAHGWGVIGEATWNGPAWSISLEAIAYLLFPVFLMFAVRFRRALPSLICAGLLCVALAGAFHVFDWQLKTAQVGVPAILRVLVEFGIGCLLYRAWLDMRPSRWWDLAAVAAAIAFVALAATNPAAVALVPVMAFAVLSVSLSSGLVRRCLGARPMVWLGEISYAVYMIHFAAILLLIKALQWTGLVHAGAAVSVVIFLGTIAVVVALAALAYCAVERPARRYLRDWPHRGRLAGAIGRGRRLWASSVASWQSHFRRRRPAGIRPRGSIER